MKNNLLKELKFYASDLNILIVEDDSELRESLIDLMGEFFNIVDSAKDGIDALEKFKKKKYDIVLTDINMPRMDGVQLSKELRLLNQEQCILVLSAYIDDFVIDLIDISIQGLIIKPYDMNKFLITISRNCENIVMKKEFKRSQFRIINKGVDTSAVNNAVGIEKLIEKKVNHDLMISNENKFNNNFSNTNLISWDIIEEDIKDYNLETSEIIDYIMLRGINQENLENLSRVFRKYYSSLILLDHLDKFSSIFENIAEYFGSLNLSLISEERLKHFDTYLYIYDDLINFFDIIFIKKESVNINYLTDSLRSSVEQMKYSLSGEKIEEEELDLF
jgi:YesN/AraC family two-component response regulator